MPVKIVTDSGSDLPLEIVRELDITVVPVYICFGEKTYRDGVDITADELYRKLEFKDYPTTIQPMPVDMAQAYQELSNNADGIVSIHLPAKLSGTYNSAIQGKVIARAKCDIEIIDSQSISMGLGLIVMAAARIAKTGATMQQVIKETRKIIPKVHIMAMLDTLKYLFAGGRISRTKATIGSLLQVKPLLSLRNGEIFQAGFVRTFDKGLEYQYQFVKKNIAHVQEIAIVHSTTPQKANELKHHLCSLIPEGKIILSRLGAGLGVHGGPGTIITALKHS